MTPEVVAVAGALDGDQVGAQGQDDALRPAGGDDRCRRLGSLPDADFRTLRETRRRLKHYLAREIYRRLNSTAALDLAAA